MGESMNSICGGGAGGVAQNDFLVHMTMSTGPTFKIPLENPISYFIEAGFEKNPLLKISLKFPLLLNKKWYF